jgi:hypothetical protein
MSAVLQTAPSKKAARQLNRKSWSACSNGDDRVRVQINEPGMAKVFARIPGVTRTGYSVMGAFTAIYLTKNSREWVKEWMRGHNNGAKLKASAALTPQTNT